MHELPPIEFEETLQLFLFDCIKKIHETQDPARFLLWAKENYGRYFEDFADQNDQAEIDAISLCTVRPIWNAMPLKSNRYQPKPLPKLGRNDRCYCGSGKKFKQCCQPLESHIPGISTEDIWPVLIEILSAEELGEAMKLKAIPIMVILGLAEEAYHNGELEFCCQTLEMLLTDHHGSLKEAADAAVNMLCNTLDDLGENRRKHETLVKFCKSDDKWISSSAHQRLASIYLDAGKPDQAWSAFQTAQRLTPNFPMLDLLELSLLLGEFKYAQAQQRAQTIKHKWMRSHYDQDIPDSFSFIESVILEPELALLGEYSKHDQEVINRLQRWVQSSSLNRNNAAYKPQTHPATALTIDPLSREEVCALNPSQKVRDLERAWFDVFPDDKPFLDQTLLETEDDFEQINEWLCFLEQNPLAFSSITILDDVVTHLQSYAGLDNEPIFTDILMPIFQQAEDILAIGGDEKRYDWSFIENRPLLRILVNQLYARWRRGVIDQAIVMMERQLRLNPNDNQGIRSMLMDTYLQTLQSQKAVELAQIFHDDAFPEIALGRVLALYQLGQVDAAADAWIDAQKHLKHAKRYLTASKLNPPEFSDYGIIMGSREQMWEYREAMRDTWLKSRGIMKWLKSI